MQKVILFSIICCICVFLTSCTTIEKIAKGKSNTAEKSRQEKQTVEVEYGKLVFMGEECVGFFSPDLTIIGSADMTEYLRKNKIKPQETTILNHFVSLGWKITGENQPDAYTVEYELKRNK